MKKLFIFIFLILCILGCSKKESSTILATIDSEKITMEEFTKELDKIPMNMKMLVATQSGKKNYLDRLIVKKLLLREAKKEKIENEKEFQDRLTDIKDQLLLESLLKKKITADLKATDEDLKKYYNTHREQFRRPKEINTRHILLKNEEDAKQMLEKLQKGEDFIELAKAYSIDPNAKTTGGELGYYPKGSLVPEYEEAAFKLAKVGQISGIVKTKFGFHIIKLEGVRGAAYVPFDEVKDFIRQNMAQAKQAEVVEKYIENLKKSANITINEESLKGEEKEEEKGKPLPKKDLPLPKK